MPGSPLPTAVQTAAFLLRLPEFFERNQARYGRTFATRIAGIGGGHQVVFSDPAAVEQIYRADPYALLPGAANGAKSAPVTGPNSLLYLDAPRHLDDRRLLLPPFHGERMRAYADTMAEETHRAMDAWPRDSAFPLRPEMESITLNVIMRAVIGVAHGERYDALHKALLQILDGGFAANLALVLPIFQRDFGPFRPWSDLQARLGRVNALLYDEIARRRGASDLDTREDVLSMLILARRKDGSGLSDVELRDEIMTLLLAGHETTATGLAWAFELLFRHPEVHSNLIDALNSGDESYLKALVTEVLRIRPVVPFNMRMVEQPIEIGGFLLEPGSTAVAAIHLVHRHPELFSQPDVFRPERFLENRPATYQWLAFGGGVRRCIGASFAEMEMQVVLKEVLLNTHLESARHRPERMTRRLVFLVPSHEALAIQPSGSRA